MTEGIWIALIAGIAAPIMLKIIGPVIDRRTDQRKEQAMAETARLAERAGLIDDLQEEVKGYRNEIRSLRVDFEAHKAKTQADADHNAVIIRHLDDEVIGLRQDISAGLVPPLRPRPPWPLRNP